MRLLVAPILGFLTAVIAGIVALCASGSGECVRAPDVWMVLIGVSAAMAYPVGWVIGRLGGERSWRALDFVALLLANSALYTGCAAAKSTPSADRVVVAKISLNFLIVGAVVAGGYFVGRRRRDQHRLGFCSCGYDLTGNVSGVCPECGATVEMLAASGSEEAPDDVSQPSPRKTAPEGHDRPPVAGNHKPGKPYGDSD